MSVLFLKGLFMVFNATYNISVISVSFIDGGNEYPENGVRTHNLVVIGTDSTDSCKSNYHTITTMRPLSSFNEIFL